MEYALAGTELASLALQSIHEILRVYRQMKEVPQTLSTNKKMLETLQDTLTLIQHKPGLQTASVTKVISDVTAIAKELQEFLDVLQKRQERNAFKRVGHTVFSGDDDEKQLGEILRRLEQSKNDLHMRLSLVQYGITKEANERQDQLYAMLTPMETMAREMHDTLGITLVIWKMLESRRSEAEGDKLPITTEELNAISEEKDKGAQQTSYISNNNLTADQAIMINHDIGEQDWKTIALSRETSNNKATGSSLQINGKIGSDDFRAALAARK